MRVFELGTASGTYFGFVFLDIGEKEVSMSSGFREEDSAEMHGLIPRQVFDELMAGFPEIVEVTQ